MHDCICQAISLITINISSVDIKQSFHKIEGGEDDD